MILTDIFIRRPVLAIVVSLLILLLGARAFNELSLREYPEVTYPVISVTTTYPGANAEQIQGFITRPMERSIASAEGLNFIEASSADGTSNITVHLRPGYSLDAAFADISAKVGQARRTLPRDAEAPIVAKQTSRDALMYLAFTSEVLNTQQITDYLDRVVQPLVSTVEGVGSAEINGRRDYAMRVWLDPARLAAFGLTASDVRNAILANNVQSAAGTIRSDNLLFYLNPQTGISDVAGFQQLVVKRQQASIVRLGDVARVELGAQSVDWRISIDGRDGVFIAINAASSANPLDVGARLRELLPRLGSQLPTGLRVDKLFDATETIRHSIAEVVKTLIEASLIVVVVIFLFLGSLRSVIIPVVTIPLSLVGVLSAMLWMDFSVNLLTLLALVLAIGLVVDDAIVVVENIQRHIEEGRPPVDAALLGAREIAFPVIVMTLTLAAVYAPIGFLGGLTGKLFIEFAFTLAGAVIVSGIIALTLSPMMCARLLHSEKNNRLASHIDHIFERIKGSYRRLLSWTLHHRPVVLVFVVSVLISIGFLFRAIPQELAPMEDTGAIYLSGQGPVGSTLEHTLIYSKQTEQILTEIPEYQRHFLANGMGGQNTFFGMLMLSNWADRARSAVQVQQDLLTRLKGISGMQVNSFNFPSIPGASPGLPLQFVLSSTGSYELVQQIAAEIEAKAKASGLFVFAKSGLNFDKPEILLTIDRDKAAQLGIDAAQISTTLGTFLSGTEVARINLDARSYQVILEVEREYRATAETIDNYYLRTAGGDLVPLSAIATQTRQNRPPNLSEFQQLNAATIGAMPRPGVSLGESISWFENNARPLMPEGFSADYTGQSRQFIEEGNQLLITFAFSFILIFLVLAAQFESFRDPLTVLVSVPLSMCGALIPLALGMATMNIYTQIGLLTLIGLISKHGILIVDFANRLRQEQQLAPREAALESAVVRLRPILMTTAAMVFGVLPLLLAHGAGAQARISIGIVITSGMLVGTLFTLFVVPVIYSFIAKPQPAAEQRSVQAPQV